MASTKTAISNAGHAVSDVAKDGFSIVREVATSKYFIRYIVLLIAVVVAFILYSKYKQP